MVQLIGSSALTVWINSGTLPDPTIQPIHTDAATRATVDTIPIRLSCRTVGSGSDVTRRVRKSSLRDEMVLGRMT